MLSNFGACCRSNGDHSQIEGGAKRNFCGLMRYFLEVSYKGTKYAGFQVQKNANTIQSELEKALETFYKSSFSLTGSSRTDAGVHALQNFFHVDTDEVIESPQLYNINSILPADIVLKASHVVPESAHSRFDAISREYKYYVYNLKNAFINDTAWFYPYPLNIDALQAAADLVKANTGFAAFAKRNTQVNTFNCTILESKWYYENNCLVYNVVANRFLRGMVRALVATMLKVARGKLSLQQFEQILTSDVSPNVDFSAKAHGLFLTGVNFPDEILK